MQLKKLTTRYVVDEDRFLISADSESGVVNLWLTQRILKQLLPHVIEWVDKNHSKQSEAAKAKVESEAPLVQMDQQARSQAASSAQQATSQLVAQHRQPVADVQADTAVQECLVRTLKFQPRDQLVCLNFELPGDVAVLLLEEEHARIWLGVLYRHWRQAQWPDIWPDWVKQAERMRRASPASLMH